MNPKLYVLISHCACLLALACRCVIIDEVSGTRRPNLYITYITAVGADRAAARRAVVVMEALEALREEAEQEMRRRAPRWVGPKQSVVA